MYLGSPIVPYLNRRTAGGLALFGGVGLALFIGGFVLTPFGLGMMALPGLMIIIAAIATTIFNVVRSPGMEKKK